MSAHGQTYTIDEAITIAHRLREMKILNEKGVQTLIARIGHTGEGYKPVPGNPVALRNMGLLRLGRPDPNTSGIPEYEEISNATILGFLAECFAGELRYRTGMEEMMDATRDLGRKNLNGPVTSESIARQQAATEKL